MTLLKICHIYRTRDSLSGKPGKPISTQKKFFIVMGEWYCWRGIFSAFPWCNYEPEFPEILGQNHQCYDWLCRHGNSKIMYCGIPFSILHYSFFFLKIGSGLVCLIAVFRLSSQTCHRLKVGWHETRGGCVSQAYSTTHACSLCRIECFPWRNIYFIV